MLYHRTVMEPHTSYPIPAGTQYILMTVQKTVFALDVLPETILTTLLQNGFRLGDFRKAKHYHQKAYKLPPPTTAHTPVERVLEPDNGGMEPKGGGQAGLAGPATSQREMERIQDQFVDLPFWCLCNGLMASVTRTPHRHMIEACEWESSFPNI
ncbi:uncharacterized protein NPIL_584411 [Nephila pilipes]|uniref:Uncharacterized protein n=1 Tax=Nephila pilipes TaxID=299642 RepID=A0A8X6MNF0_NEPPI|nr:uncharacterized protein NPIL_584411 [Nephila pilipes]